MNNNLLSFTLLIAFFAAVTAECPNACSAHGKCGAFDMCQCYRNWMSNDCSERICQFNLAHVDTPLGDLDASSGQLSGPSDVVIKDSFMYPHGITEQYPNMVDSTGAVLHNSAHAYAECSNKGICDRSTGTCNCFEGYEGSGCQRASCPTSSNGVCSGHGTCETIKHISDLDYKNHYNLWDEHATMGCVCDAGFGGPDCSEKLCKVGADPLYYDDDSNIRYSNTTVVIYTKHTTTDLETQVFGNFSLIFYDAFGEDWVTEPLQWNADCSQIINALENLPNNVVPPNTTLCQNFFYSNFTNASIIDGVSGNYETAAFTDLNIFGSTGTTNKDADPVATETSPYKGQALFAIHNKFTIAFPSNPGKLRQIEITKYLDGTRPTMYTNEEKSSLGWWIYSNGFSGEDVDMVPDQCSGVKVTLDVDTNGDPILKIYTTDGTSETQGIKTLKKCLGDSNGNSADNVDVYNWDYGTQFNPHLIKLIDATQDAVSELDPAVRDVPVTKLCNHYYDYAPHGNVNRFQGFNFGGFGFGDGFCKNLNPPGFYAVVFYDATNFRLLTHPQNDYSSSTPFHVFTTTGYLQMVNPYTAASNYPFTSAPSSERNILNAIDHAHGNEMFLFNIDNNAIMVNNSDTFHGQIDCETAPKGSYYSLDCLDKGDYVMFLDILEDPNATPPELVTKGLDDMYSVYENPNPTSYGGATTYNPASISTRNPVYPNLYQVKKVGRERVQGFTDQLLSNGYGVSTDGFAQFRDPLSIHETYDLDADNEKARHKIVLDMGVNSYFTYNTGSARVFKFHPPVYAGKELGYEYVAPCSNRGVCDTSSGVCQCFHGYTSDNCGVQNALAQ